MKKVRTLNVASLLCNAVIVLLTADAFIYNFRTDIVRSEMWLGITGWMCMRFFTVLSNLFLATVSLVFLIHNIKSIINDEVKYPKWLVVLKYVATVSVTVTFMTVVLFLAPLVEMEGKGYFSLFTGNNLYMHLITPLIAIVSLVAFEKMNGISFKVTPLSILPTALYSTVYIPMVLTGTWSDFYGMTFGGKMWVAPISAVSMFAVSYLFGIILWLLARRGGSNGENKQ